MYINHRSDGCFGGAISTEPTQVLERQLKPLIFITQSERVGAKEMTIFNHGSINLDQRGEMQGLYKPQILFQREAKVSFLY